jgi:hypothetical protein
MKQLQTLLKNKRENKREKTRKRTENNRNKNRKKQKKRGRILCSRAFAVSHYQYRQTSNPLFQIFMQGSACRFFHLPGHAGACSLSWGSHYSLSRRG